MLGALKLSEAETALVCEALQGTLLDGQTCRRIWTEVDAAIHRDQLDRKWSLDGAALVARLHALSPTACWDLALYVERFHAARRPPGV